MKKLYSKNPFLTVTLSVVLGVLVVVSGVGAATTISTNINTAGTLTVSGASSLAAVAISGAETNTGTFALGSSGTTLTQIIKGSCSSWNGSGVNSMDGTQAASTTEAYDCAVTGVVSGDVVIAQLATSTAFAVGTNLSQNWAVVGAKASSTSGYITVLLWNGGAAAVPSVTGVGSSTSYIIIR